MQKKWPSSEGLGVYVHFPFCRRRCPYCDFNVHRRSEIPHQLYADWILKELLLRLPLLDRFSVRRPAVSLYFGGGSPGLWRSEELGRVIEGVDRMLGLQSDAEITVEWNPEDVTPDAMREMRSLGVNRISLGTQSFDDSRLAALGRRHSAETNRKAAQIVSESGIEDLNLDLIWGISGDRLDLFEADLEAATRLPMTHLSTYELSIEEDTPFARRVAKGEQIQADEETRIEIDRAMPSLLEAHGLVPYEISNAALEGAFAVHNVLYWVGGHYLGLGAGAFGFVHGNREGLRTENPRIPEEYGEFVGKGLLGERPEEVRGDQFDREQLMVGLRLRDGMTLREELFLLLRNRIEELSGEGLLWADASRRLIKATDRGRLLLNRVILRLWDGFPAESGAH